MVFGVLLDDWLTSEILLTLSMSALKVSYACWSSNDSIVFESSEAESVKSKTRSIDLLSLSLITFTGSMLSSLFFSSSSLSEHFGFVTA